MPPDPRHSRLEVAQLWADLVSKMLGGLAVLVAAWWTYTNFTVERTHDPTMVVRVAPAVHRLRDDWVLLNVDVFLENIGKVAIKPRFPRHEGDGDLGLEISIVAMEPRAGPSAERPPETAGAAGAAALPLFDWTSGDGAPRPVLMKRNLLGTNEDFRQGRYQLNPGVRYREPFACVVEPDRLYAIRARFWTDEGSVADLVYVDTFARDEADGGAAGALRVSARSP
jgi:hypothetical protein